MKRSYTLFTFCFLFIGNTFAQNFGAGNIVVYRSGDGVAALSNVATATFLDEYTPLGSFVRSISLPTTVVGGQRRITCSGTATSEGLITRSSDATYIMVPGYDAAMGTTTITSSSASVINRIVGRVDYTGAVDASTASTDWATGGNPRGVTSTNGTDIWMTGSTNGVRYTTFGSVGTSANVSTSTTNLRQVSVQAGQLYISSSSGSIRLATVGTGAPTSGPQTITNLPGFPITGSQYGFFFADLDAGVAGVDVVYVADDAAGLTKYSLVAGNWTSNGTIAGAIRGLAGKNVGNNVTLYATTTAASANTILLFTDGTGYNGALAGASTLVATAAANTAFRGIAFAPQLTVVPISMTGFTAQKVGNSITLNWSTDQEINGSKFVIERSANGRNWSTINSVNASGNSSRTINYLISDHSPLSGLNYYRIKSVNIDGSAEYSIIRIVSMLKDAAMIISPNPAKDFISINYLRNNIGPITVTLADVNGKTIQQIKTTESIIRLDLRHVGKGTYLVYIIDGDKVSSEKVLIQ